MFTTRDRKMDLAATALIVILGIAIRLPYLDLPGPQGDEIYMPYVAMQLLNGDPIGQPHITIANHDLPLTIGSYTGALPVYLYWVLMSVFYDPHLFRYVNIMYAAISIVLINQLARLLMDSRYAGWMAAALFAAMPTLLFFSRVGEFVVFVRVPIFVGLAILTLQFFKTGRPVFFYLTCLLMGLGLNIRLEIIWWAPVWLVWGVLMGNRSGWLPNRPRVIVRILAIGLLVFFVGTIPYGIYLLRDWREFIAYLTVNGAVTSAGADNRLVLLNFVNRFGQLPLLLDGSALQEFGLGPITRATVNVWAFWLSVAFCVFGLLRGCRTGHRATPIELMLTAVILIVAGSVATLSVFKVWHVLVLLPFAILIMAYAFDQVTRWHPTVGWGIGAVLLLANLVASAGDYEALVQWRGGAGFSPEIHTLVAYLDHNHVRTMTGGDWGITRLVYLLSRGTIKTTEVFDYAPHPPMPDWYYDRIEKDAGRQGVWVFYAAPYGDQPAQDSFSAFLSERHIPVRVTSLSDRNGPLYTIYQLDPSD